MGQAVLKHDSFPCSVRPQQIIIRSKALACVSWWIDCTVIVQKIMKRNRRKIIISWAIFHLIADMGSLVLFKLRKILLFFPPYQAELKPHYHHFIIPGILFLSLTTLQDTKEEQSKQLKKRNNRSGNSTLLGLPSFLCLFLLPLVPFQRRPN